MKYIFSILFSLGFFALTAQTAGTIQGTVKTSDGQPAEFISVTIRGTERGTTSDEQGRFTLRNVRTGPQTVVATAVGIETTEVTLEIKPGLNRLDLVITASEEQLKEVIITARRINPLKTKRSESVAKMPLENLENPQVYTTISSALLREQVVTNFSDALKNTSGLDKLWSSTGRPGDGAAYYSLRGFTIQPSLVDGIAGLTNGDLDPSYMERIEVIKGPSGTLFGGALTNFGGLLNIVTKKPVDTVGGELSYTTGSYNLSRLTADVYGPLSKTGNLLGRVNAAYHYQNSWQDAGFRNSFFVAPTLQYQINERSTFNLGGEFYSYEGTNPLMIFLNRSRQLIARTPGQLNFDYDRSYTSNDITTRVPSVNLHGTHTYRISDSWTMQSNFSRSYRKSNGIYQYVMYVGADDLQLTRYAALQNSASNSTDIQHNFLGDFTIGGMRNRVVIGIDYLNQYTNNSNSPYIAYDVLNSGDPRSATYTSFTRQGVEARLAASTGATAKNSTNSNVYSVYASDVLNLTDQLIAMASLRVDRFDNKGTYNQATGLTTGRYLQTAVSPKFGLVFQPVKNVVSVFANYMNGFRNVAPVTQPLPDVSGSFKPQQANQIEGGVKVDAFGGRLAFTASYYDITVDNMTRSESVTRNNVVYNITVQDGTQESKGFEFDVVANPFTGFNVVAGFSHNDSKMTRSAANVQGLRPVSAGPEDLANLWMSYTVPKGKLQGFGAGFGGNYASENLITNTTTTGAFTLPSYTVFNATAYYNLRRFRFSVKLDNLSDKQYFKGWTTVEPQQPRSFMANFAFKF
jgi:iron complex outermembrane recepter protein